MVSWRKAGSFSTSAQRLGLVDPIGPFLISRILTVISQSWCQVAAEVMPAGSLIVGVDLVAIKPIPRVITFQSDITTDKCRATIRQHFKTWKADTVLHDGAPNVGTAWVQDSFNQAELALQAMKLATEFLVEGGTFVTKVFRSKDYNPLLWVLNQLFTKVEATKPPSSRNVSAEIFVVCRGYKAPKRMDPRFLDPKYVFAELSGATPNNEAKVFNPEVKKRKREGYEEGDHTQFKEVSASDFIQCTDPIAILGSSNKLTFEQASNGDVALAVLARLPETTEDIKNCCLDLKVLGRKEFKLLLKWRLRVRDILGFTTSKTTNIGDIAEDVVEIEPMDDELKIQEELQNLKDKESGKRKRERRKENERKQRDIIRMQLNMVAPMDIGMEESGPIGEGSMFTLKKVEDGNAMRRLNRGKMLKTPQVDAAKEQDSGLGSSAADTEDVSDEEEDRLDRELDSMYNAYTERKSELDAKYRAKKARGENRDEEWDGLSADGKSEEGNSSDQLDEEEDDDDDDIFADETDAVSGKVLHTALNGPNVGRDGLSKRATNFFDQDIFKGIGELEPKVLEEDEGLNAALSLASTAIVTTVKVKTAKKSSETSSSAKKSSPDLVKTTITKTLADVEVLPEEEDWESVARPPADDQPGNYHKLVSGTFPFSVLTANRYRHHHCRSNDSGSSACYWSSYGPRYS